MVAGYTEALTATVLPANATDKTVTWHSDNTAVAEVSLGGGLVTAIGPGSATITVYTNDGTLSAECAVTVHNMYIAGHEPGGQGTAAKLWVNGATQNIGSAGSAADACSVFVRGADVFVSGYQVNNFGASVATVWMNGEPDSLTPGAVNGVANSVFVSGLSDLYVAGYEENSNRISVATLWRNGQFYARLTNGGGKAEAKSVFVSGNNVYAAGYDTNNMGITVPFFSLNGSTLFLTDGSRSAGANSVFVWNGNTYVAGWENDPDGRPVAMLWENGVPRVLGVGNGMANAVHVSASGDLYVAGYQLNSRGVEVATVWRRDSAMPLTNGGSEAVANSVYILESDVYVVGYEVNSAGRPEPKIWRNGFGRSIAAEGKANSMMIAPPVI
jgi:hypothetical protein